jgi:type II secretory pathway component PulC
MPVVATLVLTGLAAGAEPVRLTGTELRADGAHRALFEIDGRIQALAAGERAGDCSVAAVRRRYVLLECADGPRRIALSGTVAARESGARHPDSRPSPAVLDVSLPRAPFRRALADRQGIAMDVAVEPAVRDGRLYGYRIAGLRPEGRFSGLGLEQGDVLLALNGAPVADPSGLMQVLRGLAGAHGFECLIERDGRPRVHRYQLVD